MPRDHYEVLGVTNKGATKAEIMKAYKKKALQWHPDKNPDRPEYAEKMFKEINQAAECLKDEQKRAHYDRFGHDEPRAGGGGQQQFRRGGGGFQHGGGMDPDMEHIFQTFFGNGASFSFGGGPQYHRQQQQQRQGGQQQQQQQRAPPEGASFNLMQVLPILFFFLITFANFGSENTSATLYTLARDPKHPYKKETAARGVAYFVGESFERKYQGKDEQLEELEAGVEVEVLRNLNAKCEVETKHGRQMAKVAKTAGDAKALHKAMQPGPNCEKLAKIFPEQI